MGGARGEGVGGGGAGVGGGGCHPMTGLAWQGKHTLYNFLDFSKKQLFLMLTKVSIVQYTSK